MKKTLLSRIVKLELYVDREMFCHYYRPMRWQAVILLIALALTAALPPSLAFAPDSDEQPSLGTLNVCHSAAPALSSNGDMPCVNECPCRHVPAVSVALTKPNVPLFPEFLLISGNERPPQA